jgi:hypothetical protein
MAADCVAVMRRGAAFSVQPAEAELEILSLLRELTPRVRAA